MKKMSKYAIVDFRIKQEAIDTLSAHFDKIIKTKPINVHKSICGHADIAVCKLNNNEISVCPSQYEYYKSELPDINIICGSSEPAYKYPEDVFFNAACNNDIAVHNFQFTDKITLAVINQKFSKHINVRQGYSKCSICFINDSVITDDDGTYNELYKNGIQALKINKGSVKLTGMDYGFFGGATGAFNNKLFVNGELRFHESELLIRNFLNEKEIEIIQLKRGALEDIGSIICLGQ